MTARFHVREVRTTGLVAMCALAMLLGACAADSNGTHADPFADPSDCTVVALVVAPDERALLTDLALEFNDLAVQSEGRCVFVTPRTRAAASVAEQLELGWDRDAGEGESAPVLWAPGSLTWGSVLDHRLLEQGRAPLAGDGLVMGRTPVVLGMLEPMARALGWPDEPVGWEQVVELIDAPDGWGSLGHPEWGEFRLAKTNPRTTSLGLLALVSQTQGATGSDDPLTIESLFAPETVRFATTIESAVIHHGDDPGVFLRHWYHADRRSEGPSYLSAVVIDERSLAAYNEGTHESLTAGGQAVEPPRTPLVAVHPSASTTLFESTVFLLAGEWVSEAERIGAEAFLDYLERPGAVDMVSDHGLVPGSDQVPVDSARLPPPSVQLQLMDRWSAQRRAVRVLLAIDSTGDEQTVAAVGDALADRLHQLRDDDEVGVLVIAGDAEVSGSAWNEVSPMAPLAARRAQVASSLTRLTSTDHVSLHDGVEHGYASLVLSHDPSRVNALVLVSAGHDNASESRRRLDEVLALITETTRSAPSHPVRVFTIGVGDTQNTESLQLLAAAGTGASTSIGDARSIDRVIDSVMSNF